jgi:outer membrane protein
MNTHRKALFASLLVLLILPGLRAQENLQLSYKEAVSIALENNVPLQQQRNNLSGIQANRSASYGSLAPDISAYGQGWRNDGNLFIEQEARVINTTSDNIYGQLNADLLLFNGLSLINTIKREENNFNAQVSFIDRTRQNIISNVTVQYLMVLQDQEQVKIAKENLENQKILLEQITAMFEAGSRAITDKYDQEYLVQNAELDVIRAENTLRNDKAVLAQTLMVTPTADYIVEEPAWGIDDIQLADYPTTDIYDIALNSRSDLASAKATEEATRRNVNANIGLYIPRLSAFYSWSSRYTDATIREFKDQFWLDNTRQQFGLQLSVPLYSGLRNRATVVNAKVRHENARLDVENQKIVVQSEVLQAYQNFQDVAKAYDVSLVQYQAAEKSLETQRESYDLGISSLIELARANRSFVEAQSTLSRSKYAMLFQKILMDFAIGTLTVDQIPE